MTMMMCRKYIITFPKIDYRLLFSKSTIFCVYTVKTDTINADKSFGIP